MAKINVLEPSVYNYIAAGEVVERPASVIKELVENSIDAKATIIEIEVYGGGIDKIRVSDNGIGIEESQIATAFLPHATSKIAKVSDLDNILTLGFRGEALASIAAVAKVEMTSKPQKQETATTIKIEGGKIISQTETGAKNGTTTIVSELFYCVPARQKFLKKPKSEEQEITNLVSRFILAHPEISFTYSADGKQIFQSSGNSLKEAMFCIYGKSSLEETLPISHKSGELSVSGYIGRPSYSKPNRTYQTLIINGRYVINQTVSTAITNAYGDMLMKRKYPFYVLLLDIPSDSVDVNVHPNKLDVRFENQSRIYSLFFEACSKALMQMDYVSSAEENFADEQIKQQLENVKNLSDIRLSSLSEPTITPVQMPQKKAERIDKAGVNLNPFSFNLNATERQKDEYEDKVVTTLANKSESSTMQDGFGLGSKLLERLKDNNTKVNNYAVDNATQESMGVKAAIKKVGKLFNTYLIVEVDEDVFFIDQHAAHERLLYEKFKNQYDNKTIAIQPMLFPYVLSLNPLESNIISENIDAITSLGFDIEEFGKNTFKINAIPAIVSEMNFDTFFSEFLSESKNFAKKTSELIKEYLMQHACKSAIKGGNDLTSEEINHLFEDMGKEKIALFCPHGRPIAIRLSRQEIEKWFKRIV